MTTLTRLVLEEDAQDMVEYALTATFVSIAAVVALRALAPLVRAMYERIQAALS
jgi:Flp pilus assembly pilin Flp